MLQRSAILLMPMASASARLPNRYMIYSLLEPLLRSLRPSVDDPSVRPAESSEQAWRSKAGDDAIVLCVVTLAFAEVARILALSVDITGGGVGLMLPLQTSAANMQFESKLGFFYLILFMVVIALLLTQWLKNSRVGAYLQAVRDNEDAARAAGVNPFRVKLSGIVLSGAMMGATGAFYVQVYIPQHSILRPQIVQITTD